MKETGCVPMLPFKIEPGRAQLLLIDLQERMLRAVSDQERIIRNAGILIEAAKTMGVPIKYTEHYPKGLGETVPPLKGKMPPLVLPFEKIHFSCCDEKGFDEYLTADQRDQLIISGVESHICVLATVMDLLSQGFSVAVAADACSSRDPEHHRLASKAMAAAGALVVPVETLAYQLIRQAGTEQFKAMLPFFKA